MADPFMPSAATVNITVGAASASVALGIAASGGATQVRVMNNGTATVWIAFGTSSVAATSAAGVPVPAGGVEVLTCPALTTAPYVAAIAAAATGIIYFTPGMGV